MNYHLLMKYDIPSFDNFIKTLNLTPDQLEDCLDDIRQTVNQLIPSIRPQAFLVNKCALETSSDFLRFDQATLTGKCQSIKDSQSFCFFALTIGEQADRAISEISAADPFLGVFADSFANYSLYHYMQQSIEQLAQQFQQYSITKCVEMGNDIFDIHQMPAFFSILKQDTITLAPSHLMLPQKSVAYLICLKEKSACQNLSLHNCATCPSKMCPNRRDGFVIATVVTSKGEDKIQVLKGTTADKVLQKLNIPHYAPCGGKGICGKCKILIDNPEEAQPHDLVLGEDLINKGYRLACKYSLNKNTRIIVEETTASIMQDAGVSLEKAHNKDGEYTVAIDIGTTTIVAYLLCDGKPVDKVGFVNSQSAFGADVVSRIEYCVKNGIEDLHKTLVSALNDNVVKLCRQNNADVKIETCFVCANTVMLHTLVNKSISGFACAPFTPQFLEKQTVNAADIGIEFCKKVVTCSNISSFVGADIVAGIVSTNLQDGCNLLLDLGTNGEIVLSANGKLYACSTAAGPALEGGELDCGMSGVDGAIYDVDINNGTVDCKYYGSKPVGICGSGILKAISEFLRLGIIDETGRFNKNADDNLKQDRYYLTPDVYISQKDIRAVQLAKSAIFAGVETLLEVANVSKQNLQKVFIAGGFGSYIQKHCLFTLGLLDKQLQDKIVIAGNTSIGGAILWLSHEELRNKFDEVALQTTTVQLNSHPTFSELFVEGINFE